MHVYSIHAMDMLQEALAMDMDANCCFIHSMPRDATWTLLNGGPHISVMHTKLLHEVHDERTDSQLGRSNGSSVMCQTAGYAWMVVHPTSFVNAINGDALSFDMHDAIIMCFPSMFVQSLQALHFSYVILGGGECFLHLLHDFHLFLMRCMFWPQRG